MDQNLTVKVADFGLAIDVSKNEYLILYDEVEKKAFAVRWASLETLKENVFTFETDVVTMHLLHKISDNAHVA